MRLATLRGILLVLALLALAIGVGLWRAPSLARVGLERAAHARFHHATASASLDLD